MRRAVNDEKRREVVASLDILNFEPDADFDRLTRLAARVFNMPYGLVTLLDQDTQWMKSCFGVSGMNQLPVEDAFCAFALASSADHFVVLDMLKDPLFVDHPLVTGPTAIRFYIGAPIIVHGQKLGTLCVLGTEPRESVSDADVAELVDLAAVASSLFNLKNEARVRARTAEELLKEEWRHALTLEAGKVGSWVWDTRSGEVSCNDMFRRMCDLHDTGKITMDMVFGAVHAADLAAMRQGIDGAFNDGNDFNVEVRVADTDRWLMLRGRVYQRDDQGRPLLMMGASLDITETKQSAEQTRLLLRELNHRVKNTLAMIQSLARQTVRQNPDPEEFIRAFSGRLRTLSDAHVLLANRDWSGIRLYEIVQSQFGENFLTNPNRVYVSGEDMMLPADHALGLGLILHELTTNAHKHGAWSTEHGDISISWDVKLSPVRGLSLHWKESDGPTVADTREIGLGTKLIQRSLSKVLDSEVDLQFLPGGVEAQIWVPLLETED